MNPAALFKKILIPWERATCSPPAAEVSGAQSLLTGLRHFVPGCPWLAGWVTHSSGRRLLFERGRRRRIFPRVRRRSPHQPPTPTHSHTNPPDEEKKPWMLPFACLDEWIWAQRPPQCGHRWQKRTKGLQTCRLSIPTASSYLSLCLSCCQSWTLGGSLHPRSPRCSPLFLFITCRKLSSSCPFHFSLFSLPMYSYERATA